MLEKLESMAGTAGLFGCVATIIMSPILILFSHVSVVWLAGGMISVCLLLTSFAFFQIQIR